MSVRSDTLPPIRAPTHYGPLSSGPVLVGFGGEAVGVELVGGQAARGDEVALRRRRPSIGAPQA